MVFSPHYKDVMILIHSSKVQNKIKKNIIHLNLIKKKQKKKHSAYHLETLLCVIKFDNEDNQMF